MADVYLAEDLALGRLVAVKILKPELATDHDLVERFRIEAQAAAQLNHPNIVTVYDRGATGESAYIVMEYVRGETVKQRVRRAGRFAPDEAIEVGLAVLAALEAAHERQIVHRDVTSANVMIDERRQVKVTDFGIARIGAPALTRTGTVLGTSAYVSPEQAQGRRADERSDLYSLGVVLYEMLTGRLPFTGDSDVAVAVQHASAAPPDPRLCVPELPETLVAIVNKALSKEPGDRFQSAAEFAAALRRVRAPQATADASLVPVAAAVPAQAVSAPDAEHAATGTPAAAPAGLDHAPGVPTSAPRSPAASGLAAVASGDPSPVAATPGPSRVRRSVSVAQTQPPAPPSGDEAAAPTGVTRYRTEAAASRVAAHDAPGGGRAAPVFTRGRRRIWRVAGVGLILVAVVAAGWALGAYVYGAGGRVPSVTGREEAAAVAAVKDEGLQPVTHDVWADDTKAGRVDRQRPAAGTKVEDGTKVDLWISRGPLHVPTPNLVGLDAAAADKALGDLALEGRRRKAASATAPEGEVFRQRPAEGASVARGETVTYWVSTGPPLTTVPDVVGLPSGTAVAALEQAGFVVSIDYVLGWGVYPGDVVAQDPEAGTRLRAGDEVVIEVAVL